MKEYHHHLYSVYNWFVLKNHSTFPSIARFDVVISHPVIVVGSGIAEHIDGGPGTEVIGTNGSATDA